MDRNAEAQWQGDLKSGRGSLSVGSKAFSDWNRFFAKGGITGRFEPPPARPPAALVIAGLVLLLALALNELRGRRLDLPKERATA